MKIALIGYGKMGKAIEEIALQKGHTVVLKVNDENLQDLTEKNLRNADVAIEFTVPASAVDNVILCFKAGVPVVCGTTGWLDRKEEVLATCRKMHGTFLTTTNFSIGVNIFFEVNKQLARLMNEQDHYEVALEETHHIHKKDAPSGTAITLAEGVIDNMRRKEKWLNKESTLPQDLPVISKREDEVPGTHKVKYDSPEDSIEIIHTAYNRKGFAAGALKAAEFIHDKQGLFTMKDVLGI